MKTWRITKFTFCLLMLQTLFACSLSSKTDKEKHEDTPTHMPYEIFYQKEDFTLTVKDGVISVSMCEYTYQFHQWYKNVNVLDIVLNGWETNEYNQIGFGDHLFTLPIFEFTRDLTTDEEETLKALIDNINDIYIVHFGVLPEILEALVVNGHLVYYSPERTNHNDVDTDYIEEIDSPYYTPAKIVEKEKLRPISKVIKYLDSLVPGGIPEGESY